MNRLQAVRKLQAAIRRKYAVDRNGTLAINFASLGVIPRRHAVAIDGHWYDARSLADWWAAAKEHHRYTDTDEPYVYTNPRTAREVTEDIQDKVEGTVRGEGIADGHLRVTWVLLRRMVAEIQMLTYGGRASLRVPAPGWTLVPGKRATKVYKTVEGRIEGAYTPLEAIIRVVRYGRTVLHARMMLESSTWKIELHDPRLRSAVEKALDIFKTHRIVWL